MQTDNYFLFGCDSCDVVTKFYHRCFQLVPNSNEKCILITADTNYRVKNANEEFKHKFVCFTVLNLHLA